MGLWMSKRKMCAWVRWRMSDWVRSMMPPQLMKRKSFTWSYTRDYSILANSSVYLVTGYTLYWMFSLLNSF